MNQPGQQKRKQHVLVALLIVIAGHAFASGGMNNQDTVQWNLYNKVIRTVNTGDTSSRSFTYDGAGNRVMKTYNRSHPTSGLMRNDYYVHDARGNILAIYHVLKQFAGSDLTEIIETADDFLLAEHDIYGSARLGVKDYYADQVGYDAISSPAGTLTEFRVDCDAQRFSDTDANTHRIVLRKGSQIYDTTLKYSNFTDNPISEKIDVRVHIENYDSENNLVNTICMDDFGRFYYDKLFMYKKNKKLFSYFCNILPAPIPPK